MALNKRPFVATQNTRRHEWCKVCRLGRALGKHATGSKFSLGSDSEFSPAVARYTT